MHVTTILVLYICSCVPDVDLRIRSLRVCFKDNDGTIPIRCYHNAALQIQSVFVGVTTFQPDEAMDCPPNSLHLHS